MQAIYRKLITGTLVKHGFLRLQDMFQEMLPSCITVSRGLPETFYRKQSLPGSEGICTSPVGLSAQSPPKINQSISQGYNEQARISKILLDAFLL